MHTIMKYAFKLILSSVLGVLLLCLSYYLPETQIVNNISESLVVLKDEGTYPELIKGYIGSRLDNFTDARIMTLMLSKPYSPLKNALLNPYLSYENKNPIETLEIYQEDNNASYTQYGRYWCGFLFPLRIIFEFFSLKEFRQLNIAVQFLILLYLLRLILHQRQDKFIAPIVFWYISLFPAALMLSIQFSTVYYISCILSIAILKAKDEREPKYKMILFVGGIATAYFDFLTYPIVCLCLPLYMIVISDEEGTLIQKTIMLKYCFIWTIGYVAFWIMKWVLGTTLMNADLIGDAMNQISIRSGNEVNGSLVTYLDVLKRNCQIVFNNKGLIACILFYILFHIAKLGCLKHKYRITFCRSKAFCFLFISLLPLIWYRIAMNHSYIHFWFTYRDLSVVVLCTLSIVSCFESITNECEKS